jgi:hypothetical protein
MSDDRRMGTCPKRAQLVLDDEDDPTSRPICLEHVGPVAVAALLSGGRVGLRLPQGKGEQRCTR